MVNGKKIVDINKYEIQNKIKIRESYTKDKGYFVWLVPLGKRNNPLNIRERNYKNKEALKNTK